MEKLTGGTLTPAFGRDYRSKVEAEADFRAGKDFVLHSTRGSGYCSCRDFEAGASVQIRNRKGNLVAVVEV